MRSETSSELTSAKKVIVLVAAVSTGYEPSAEGAVERSSDTMTFSIFLPSSIEVMLDWDDEFKLMISLANILTTKPTMVAITTAKRNSMILKPEFFMSLSFLG